MAAEKADNTTSGNADDLREIRVRPDFVKVAVRPYSGAAEGVKPGLYHFEIEVPQDAPECHHLGVHQGQVVVEFDHPRVQNVAVKLNFAVKAKLPD